MSPCILLVNDPVPDPSVVRLSLMVGLGCVAQHTPLEVTLLLPAEMTFPPEIKVPAVNDFTSDVVTAGRFSVVTNITSFPYLVPMLLTA